MAEHNANGNLPVQNGFARSLEPIAVRLGPGQLANRLPAPFARGILSLAPDNQWLVWSALIKVTEAGAFRIHLRDVELPTGAVLFVYSDPAHALGPFDVSLRDPLGGMWLPAVEGELAYIEVQVPMGQPSRDGELSFTIDKIAELFRDNAGSPNASVVSEHSAAPSAQRAVIPTTAPSCLVDSPCVTSSTLSVIADYRAAVAQLQYVKSNGNSYVCSGALVNDKDPSSFIPYLLTANHCFSTQTEASSVTAYFDYVSAYCNGTDPCCRWNFPSVSGATLLDSRAVSDFTFIRLNSLPTGYRYFLGWTTASLSDGQIMHRLSHPAPDNFPLAQRYSQSSYEASGGITCSDLPRPNFLYSAETWGTTTGGSSGAPVIIDGNGGQIVGQLHGACHFSSWDWCTYWSYNTIDGAFATTFPYISRWLDPTVTVNSASTSPATIAAGDTFTIAYNVTASVGTNVLLGASLRPSGTSSWAISDPPHDRLVTLADGSSSVSRQFTMPASSSPGDYDVLIAVWRDSNANGIIDSGDIVLDSAILFRGEIVAGSNQTLTVTKLGTGSGTVTSSPAAINCGSTCSASFAYNTTVTLTAAASVGSSFTGWSGACTGAFTQCSITMSQASAVSASFDAGPQTLVVTRNGTGSGGVTSSPSGINCGTTCQADFAYNSQVTLTATATGGSSFSGWSGACSGSSTQCTVTMWQGQNVTGTFSSPAPRPQTLMLSLSGSGSGTVTSSPAGINCGGTCSYDFAYNTSVTLTATATNPSTFAGWSGEGCSGTGTCQVTMSQARNVTATFTPSGVGSAFYVLTPCRLIDTRNSIGPYGGPSLGAGLVRSVPAAGACSIPVSATSVAVNVTAVSPSADGWLTLFPGPLGSVVPFTSTLNYAIGKTRANNATVSIGTDGTINVYNSGPNAIHFIIDVNGYFQ